MRTGFAPQWGAFRPWMSPVPYFLGPGEHFGRGHCCAPGSYGPNVHIGRLVRKFKHYLVFNAAKAVPRAGIVSTAGPIASFWAEMWGNRGPSPRKASLGN
ncbi:hypothetical protein D2Q93_15030 [Alicyclobacillaceae bacterium I2511]|nr:hypothetical protein D2Q93_15030 [Alicyclobacillaceae bacterium I2511]